MKSLRLALTLSPNPARKDGSQAVWLRIHLDKRLYYNTGFSVLPDDWDKGKERVRRDPQTTAALHAIKGRAQRDDDGPTLPNAIYFSNTFWVWIHTGYFNKQIVFKTPDTVIAIYIVRRS